MEITESKIIEITAEVIDLEESEISIDDALINDLGADSLDIVDLSFSLGKAFGIKLPAKTILVMAQEMSDESFVESSRLTELGAELLCQGPNKYSTDDVKAGTYVNDVLENNTLKSWLNLCQFVAQHESKNGDKAVKEYIEGFLSLEVA